jgi:hypothetical protein
MKTIRLVLSALAITLAGAAVYANASLDTVYYRAAQDVSLDPEEGPDCDFVTTVIECSAGSHQCTHAITISPGVTKTYRISKILDGTTTCVVVPKP